MLIDEAQWQAMLDAITASTNAVTTVGTTLAAWAQAIVIAIGISIFWQTMAVAMRRRRDA